MPGRFPFHIVFFLFSLPALTAKGQRFYSKNDSVRIYDLLERTNHFLNENDGIDSANRYCLQALTQSRAVHFKKGEAEAILLLFTIELKKSETLNLDAYNSIAFQLGQDLNDSSIITGAFNNKGIHAYYFGRHQEAILFFEKALAFGYEEKQNDATASIYNSIGNAYMDMAVYDKQMQWQAKSLVLYEKLGHKKGVAQVLDNIAGINLEMGNNDQSIRNAGKSLAIREELGNYEELATGYNNLAQIYHFSGNGELAAEYGKKGLEYAALCGFKPNLAHAYTTQTLLLNRQGKNKDALMFEKKTIDILEKTGNYTMLSRRYISAAILSNSKEVNDSVASENYYQKALDLATRLNARMNIRDAYLYRSGFYRRHYNFEKAYSDYTRYILWRDSLVNEDTKSKIADIEKKYETEKKDHEIRKLYTEQRIKELEIEKQNALLAGNKKEALRKQNEIELLTKERELQELKIKQQDEEIEKQMLQSKNSQQQILLAETEKKLNEKQLRGQQVFRNFLIGGLLLVLLLGALAFNRFQLKKKLEQQKNLLAMRNNISQNLHDDIGASLSNINILNELVKRNLDDRVKSTEYLSKSGEDIQRISESLSDIVWNINPRYDDLQNLFIRMKRYAADMMDGRNIRYEIEFPEDPDKITLSMEKRRDLYLIFKEAVNNLVKYSMATNAAVKLETDRKSILLSITDNGTGFDSSKIQYGNGMTNMQQRARACNATLEINSRPGGGTEIKLDMQTT